MGLRVGYFKPVGQGQKMVEGRLQDPDVILMKDVMELSEPLELISPIVLSKRYLDQVVSDCERITERAMDAYVKVSSDKDIILIESAANPESLTCCDLDVPRFSKEFNAGVLLSIKGEDDTVAERAIMYKFFLEQKGGKMLGAVLNLVPFQQLERMRGIVSAMLGRCGLEVLGIVPDHRELTLPSVHDIVDALDADVLAGENKLDTLVDDYIVGAMTPESAMSWLRRSVGKAMITGGDRTDLILVALETRPSAIILTGNIYPSARVITAAEEKSIPVLLVPDDTYTSVTKLELLRDRVFPSPTSSRKIQLARQMISEYVDWRKILDTYVNWKSERVGPKKSER